MAQAGDPGQVENVDFRDGNRNLYSQQPLAGRSQEPLFYSHALHILGHHTTVSRFYYYRHSRHVCTPTEVMSALDLIRGPVHSSPP